VTAIFFQENLLKSILNKLCRSVPDPAPFQTEPDPLIQICQSYQKVAAEFQIKSTDVRDRYERKRLCRGAVYPWLCADVCIERKQALMSLLCFY